MVDVSVIDALPVFRLLTEADRAALAQVVESQECKRGDVLFRPGDARSILYVILSGDVAITSAFYGSEQTVVVYHEHDVISLLSVFPEASAHTNGAHIQSPTAHLLQMRREMFLALRVKQPMLMERLLLAASATAEQRLGMANRKLFTFYTISRILRGARSLSEAGPQLLSVAMTATDATRGLFLLQNSAMDTLGIAAVEGFADPQQIRAWESKFAHDALVGTVIERAAPLAITHRERRWASLPYASDSMLLVPLLAGARVLGVLVLADRISGRPFRDNSILLVESVAQQLVDAAERSRLTQQQEATQHLKRTYVGPYGE